MRARFLRWGIAFFTNQDLAFAALKRIVPKSRAFLLTDPTCRPWGARKLLIEFVGANPGKSFAINSPEGSE
jgi:hypothetical protein